MFHSIMVQTYKMKFNRKYNQPLNKSNSILEISRLTGYDKKGLQTIFNKGVGAFKTNPQSVRPHIKSADAWGMARLYASINPSSKAYKIDKVHLVKSGTTKKELTDKQKDMLKKHKVHHTKKHMDFMKKEMMNGSSFTTAHNKAKKMVGK